MHPLATKLLGLSRPIDPIPNGDLRLARVWWLPTVLYAAYALALLLPLPGHAGSLVALASVPLAVVGLRYGAKAGLAAAIANIPATLLLLRLAEGSWLPSPGTAVAVGLALPLLTAAASGTTAEVVLAWRMRSRDQSRDTEELRVHDERLQQVADASASAWFIADVPTRSMLYVSPLYDRVMEASPDVLARDMLAWTSLVADEDRRAVERALLAAQAGGVDVEFRRKRSRDGPQKWIRFRMVAVPAPPGGSSRLAGWFEDTTAAREQAESLRDAMQRLEQVNARLQALVDVCPVAVVATDINGLTTTWNRAAEQLLGWPAPEVLGKPVPGAPAGAEPGAAPAGGPVVALQWQRRDGRAVTIEYHQARADGSGGSETIGVLVDISDRLRAQQEAVEVVRLREATQYKSTFLNMAAHELATPLTPLQLQMAMLLETPAAKADPDTYRLLDRNIRRLSLLVQDLLDAARLQSGKLRITAVRTDAAQAAQDAVRSFAAKARADGVRLELAAGGPCHVHADPIRLDQVLLNLIHNAVKFTPAGGLVRVDARSEGDEVIVEVQDTGLGMREEQLRRLFEPFGQVHALDERPDKARTGTGLGLYIAKGIVEEHGGQLAASSPGPGLGSTFRVTLPRRPDAAPEPPAAAGEPLLQEIQRVTSRRAGRVHT